MFTGLITDIGEVAAVSGVASRTFKIRTHYPLSTLALGASIACNGACLTVTSTGEENGLRFFTVDASPHTLLHTTLGSWDTGKRIHLESALKMGDAMGGHMVTGHIDGIATLLTKTISGTAVDLVVECPENLSPFLATKGSVALDGTSLTVTWAEKKRFGVTLIPHTLAVTTWGDRKEGDMLNLEVDLIARYVKNMIDASPAQPFLSSSDHR